MTAALRRIQVLPDRLVNQIAAGEVVERPASVVKELIENALDAGATRVEVAIRNGGKTEIRVADDGSGMIREDALLALERHATSKIREVDDLASLRTLGFRGEALPSIASVSRFTLDTAARDADGTRIVVSGGQIVSVEPIARRHGTTVAARTLFFNVPARSAFLRSAAAEARAISDVVTALALAHPRIGFLLESNGKSLLDLPAAADLRTRIADIWGPDEADELIPVAHQDSGVLVNGLVQRPAAATPGSRRSYLFVDGRGFGDRSLVRAADRAYRTTVAPGIRASLFLFLEVPAGAVDVNVHPAKAEVRFRDALGVERAVEDAVRAALARIDSSPSVQRSVPQPTAEHSAGGSADEWNRGSGSTRSGGDAAVPPAPVAAAGAEPQMSLFIPAPEAGESPATPAGAPLQLAEASLVSPLIWQLHNTYLLAETRSGLIIVDQHSAHERVLFEELMRSFGNGGQESQRLLFPLTIRLSPAEFSLVQELAGLFERAGFEIEPFGGRSVIVHAVPNPHPYFDPERCLREMITELAHGSPLVNAARNQHERIGLSFACKAAIKAGQKLSTDEMRELFDRLFATELPYHDIHGRPTVIRLSIDELHNRFRRSG
jgi:DNA mismatch repair protein MutL